MWLTAFLINLVFFTSIDTYQGRKMEILTTDSGQPIADKINSLTAGPRGPVLLQDIVLLDDMAHFVRERIPERMVHAKGAGAFGHFVVTQDITKYTKAKLFSKVGKKTPLAVRFSTASFESGSADTVRDLRGFALKFYTEEGNFDLVGNGNPIFFLRDSLLFSSIAHVIKRNPVTHIKDPTAFWDFFSLRPETTHLITWLFTDLGTPDGYRHIDGSGINTFKLVNAENEAVYCKFHYKTQQGIRNLTADMAIQLAGSKPDYATEDLYNAIDNGNFPSWIFYIQVMTFEDARNYEFNPFDATKLWPESRFPLIEVGQFTLNRNPTNYFQDVEQIAMDPSHLVPGIEPSPDKVLQARLIAYKEAQVYRLGINNQQLPINCPFQTKVRNYQRDGKMSINNPGGALNYFPNSFGGPKEDPRARSPSFLVSREVDRYNSEDEDNFTQVGMFYRKTLNEAERRRLVENVARDLVHAKKFIQERAVRNFAQADPDYGRRVARELDRLNALSDT